MLKVKMKVAPPPFVGAFKRRKWTVRLVLYEVIGMISTPTLTPIPHPRIRIDVILRSCFFFFACQNGWEEFGPPYFKKTMQRNWKFSFKFVLYMHKLNSTRHNMFFLRYTGYESGWLIKILDCPSDEWCLSHRTQTTGLPQGHRCVHLECVCN